MCPLAPSALSCHSGICWGGGIFLLPDDSATVVPCGGLVPGGTGYPCRCGTRRGGLPALPPAYPAFGLPFCPHPPCPPSRRGRGRILLYFAGGFAPGTPALNRLRHLQSLPCGHPAGGLAPGGIGSTRRCGARRGAFPRRHWLSPPLWCPEGAEPARHLLSLPRGRGPSQTPKFLSPGPPSPWLPALPIEWLFYRFCAELATPKAHLRRVSKRRRNPASQEAKPHFGYLLGRFCKCRKRFNAGVPGAKPPAK